jgi:hypothetical protein
MLQRAKSILRTNEFTALYDKGYHTGSEFDMAESLGIGVMVAIPGKCRCRIYDDSLLSQAYHQYYRTKQIQGVPQGSYFFSFSPLGNHNSSKNRFFRLSMGPGNNLLSGKYLFNIIVVTEDFHKFILIN